MKNENQASKTSKQAQVSVRIFRNFPEKNFQTALALAPEGLRGSDGPLFRARSRPNISHNIEFPRVAADPRGRVRWHGKDLVPMATQRRVAMPPAMQMTSLTKAKIVTHMPHRPQTRLSIHNSISRLLSSSWKTPMRIPSPTTRPDCGSLANRVAHWYPKSHCPLLYQS